MAESKASGTKATTAAGPTAPVVGAGEGRNVLTDALPQPPGVRERRARRVARKERKGPFVKYVGPASHRVIQASDWGQLGFAPKGATESDPGKHSDFSWEVKNDYMIESSEFTDEQLDYLLIDDMQPGGGHSFLEVDWDTDDDGNRVLVQVVEEYED